MEKYLLLLATLCGFIVVIIKLPNFDETLVISIVSGFIFWQYLLIQIKEKMIIIKKPNIDYVNIGRLD
jgi:hypothetical protein